MQENQPKTFEEINETLQGNLKQISGEIEEIERHLQIAQEMFEQQMQVGANEEALAKYKKGIEELEKGLEMFLKLREEMEQTIARLHATKNQADEFIK